MAVDSNCSCWMFVSQCTSGSRALGTDRYRMERERGAAMKQNAQYVLQIMSVCVYDNHKCFFSVRFVPSLLFCFLQCTKPRLFLFACSATCTLHASDSSLRSTSRFHFVHSLFPFIIMFILLITSYCAHEKWTNEIYAFRELVFVVSLAKVESFLFPFLHSHRCLCV